MIEHFKPPTDNLYKLLALSGLAIVLAAGWAHLTISLQAQQLQHEVIVKRDEAFISLPLKVLATEHSKLLAELLKLEKSGELKKLDSITEGELISVGASEELAKAILDFRDVSQKSLVKLYETVDAHKDRENFLGEKSYELNLLRFAFVIGCVLAWGGFYLWYQRVQKPLDRLMELEIQRAEKEVA